MMEFILMPLPSVPMEDSGAMQSNWTKCHLSAPSVWCWTRNRIGRLHLFATNLPSSCIAISLIYTSSSHHTFIHNFLLCTTLPLHCFAIICREHFDAIRLHCKSSSLSSWSTWTIILVSESNANYRHYKWVCEQKLICRRNDIRLRYTLLHFIIWCLCQVVKLAILLNGKRVNTQNRFIIFSLSRNPHFNFHSFNSTQIGL